MKANFFNLSRTVGLLAGAALLVTGVRAAEADAMPVFSGNYIKVSGIGASLSGSKEAFQARTQIAKSGAAGIEDLNYAYDLDKNTNLEINGKAMPGLEDYLLSLKLSKNELGSIEAGYKRVRTFYDGAGGFFPVNNAWMPTYPRALYVDRGNFFVNGSITLPNAPVVTFKYSNQTRTGQKDSTIWGDTNLTGLSAVAGRKILPNINTLNERQETWELSVKQTAGNTTGIVSIGGDRINNADARTLDRNLGEIKAYGTIANTPATQPVSLTSNQTRGTDAQNFTENAFTAGAKIETVVSDQVTVFGGVTYFRENGSISASRLVTTTIATGAGIEQVLTGYTAGGRPPYSYTSNGHVHQDVLTGNVGVQAKPMPDLSIEAALRAERYYDSGDNSANYVANLLTQSTGAYVTTYVPAPQHLSNSEKPWTPALDVRYTGIKTLALYGSWEYRTTTQEEKNSYGAFNVTTSGANAGLVSGSTTLSDDHIKEKHSNFKIGGNWTPVSMFSARAEFFTKDHQNRFNDFVDSSYYVLDYDIYGVKLTGIVKPTPVVSFTTRYIVQRGKAKVNDDFAGPGDSGDSRRYNLGETVDWAPTKSLYVQANANLVYDTIITSYPRVTGLAQTVVQNADNNYWDGNVVTGIVVDKETDVQLEATYYKANNYNPAFVAYTLPYGMSVRDYTVTAGVKRKFGPQTVGCAKIGYLESTNTTTGGNTNYRGPLAYVSLEHAF